MQTLCVCGCGGLAPLGARYACGVGWVKDKPMRFIHGHNRMLAATDRRHSIAECNAYHRARQRCTNSKYKDWAYYGGRGIEFRFTSFEQFFTELGPRPSAKHSLDRWPNNDGHYAPGNVRWATAKEQAANRRIKTIDKFSNDELFEELKRRGAL